MAAASETAAALGEATSRAGTAAGRASNIVIGLAFALLAAPVIYDLGTQTWSQDAGAHGPLVLATALWLIWRRLSAAPQRPRSGPWLASLLIVSGVVICTLGSICDYVTLQAAGLYLTGLGIVASVYGGAILVREWFPFLYLAFCIPPPSLWLARITLPLKALVSFAATSLLAGLGMPVSREGVTIFVAQYQLLVEDACSGMNSLIGLIAIGLLYVYLRRGASPLRTAVLLGLIVPVAILANVVRIILLILTTYFLGDELAQGILHPIAGVFLFLLALIIIFAIDEVLTRLPGFARSGR